MITHKILSEEAKELKKILKNGEMIIPTFWECCRPALIYWVVMMAWVFFVFNFTLSGELLLALMFTSFLCFLLFLGITGTRGNYLAIPSDFRRKSICLKGLKKKLKLYIIFYFSTLMAFGLFLKLCVVKLFALFFVVPHLFLIIFIIAIFSIDISRYQLSAFVAIIEQFKDQHKKESV
ncbi:MAG TPA: hypothetical protein ACHBZ9_21105 [Arsenophonus nasoniae]|uniref:hypothetical protein n=1 Tax=Arsenophonus nasoniae TaxID=638 RepID=UPI0038790596